VDSFDEISKYLRTGTDFIRWAMTRMGEADVHFGHGTDNAMDEAVQLVLHGLHLPYGCPDRLLDTRLTVTEQKTLYELVRRRVDERIPAAYLTGEAYFCGMKFIADERALVPRSPIAELIESRFEPWVDPEQVHSILDLCTGGGCIAIACAHHFPDAQVVATDLSEDALALATENLALHGLHALQGQKEQLVLKQGDLFDAVPADSRFDIIVSNPPYVDSIDMDALPNEYRHEPVMALAAGNDGLDLVRRMLREARHYLADGGILVVEVGNSAPALAAAYPQVEFTWLDFERGGDGVFLLTAEQLGAHADAFVN
jgi:ribosomal protein L3 glutamine methyltransferase